MERDSSETLFRPNEFKVSMCYYFDRGANRWEPGDVRSLEVNDLPDQLALGHLNVLFGTKLQRSCLGRLTKDRERIEAIIDELSGKQLFDLVGLNEVDERFLSALLAHRRIRDYFYLSAVQITPQQGSIHDCLILSRVPFLLAATHRRKFAVLNYSTPLVFGSLHLTAYEGSKYQRIRDQQLREVRDFLASPRQHLAESGLNLTSQTCLELVSRAWDAGQVFISGDLNLHGVDETGLVYKHGFEDVWLNLRGSEEGFTWDAQRNSLIQLLLPFDNRRMRLDRMLAVGDKQPPLFPARISIFADVPLPVSTLFKRVHMSDHFGLKTMLVSEQSFPRQPSADYLAVKSRVVPQRFRSIQTIIVLRCLAMLLVFLAVFGLYKVGRTLGPNMRLAFK